MIRITIILMKLIREDMFIILNTNTHFFVVIIYILTEYRSWQLWPLSTILVLCWNIDTNVLDCAINDRTSKNFSKLSKMYFVKEIYSPLCSISEFILLSLTESTTFTDVGWPTAVVAAHKTTDRSLALRKPERSRN